MTLQSLIELQYKSAKTFLSSIHDELNEDELLNLHTFFYHIGQEKCPICEYRLTSRIELVRSVNDSREESSI